MDNEFNIEVVVRELWIGRWFILLSFVLFLAFGLYYAKGLPDQFRSVGLYAPAKANAAANPFGGSQYAGLAAMAGLSNGGVGEVDQALLFAKSRAFLESVIESNNLAPYLIAGRWRPSGLTYDSEMFDGVEKAWLGSFEGKPELVLYEAYRKLKKNLVVSKNEAANVVEISYISVSPELSFEVIGCVVEALNLYFGQRAVQNAELNIEFLRQRIGGTSFSDLQKVFFGMIEDEMKNLMLAKSKDGYLLKVLAPPLRPVKKTLPRRGILVIMISMFGVAFSCALILVKKKYF